jgi:hypothetical protein
MKFIKLIIVFSTAWLMFSCTNVEIEDLKSLIESAEVAINANDAASLKKLVSETSSDFEKLDDNWAWDILSNYTYSFNSETIDAPAFLPVTAELTIKVDTTALNGTNLAVPDSTSDFVFVYENAEYKILKIKMAYSNDILENFLSSPK